MQPVCINAKLVWFLYLSDEGIPTALENVPRSNLRRTKQLRENGNYFIYFAEEMLGNEARTDSSRGLAAVQ